MPARRSEIERGGRNCRRRRAHFVIAFRLKRPIVAPDDRPFLRKTP
jgi:hypothetical protein